MVMKEEEEEQKEEEDDSERVIHMGFLGARRAKARRKSAGCKEEM